VNDPIESIAILPFNNVGEDEANAALAFGIPTSIASDLARLELVKLVKPPSVFQRYQVQDSDPQSVAKEQGVRAVIVGSVEHYGDPLSVTVNLIDGKKKWAHLGSPVQHREIE